MSHCTKYTILFDGSCRLSRGESGCGVALYEGTKPKGKALFKARAQLGIDNTSSVADYMGLIHGFARFLLRLWENEDANGLSSVSSYGLSDEAQLSGDITVFVFGDNKEVIKSMRSVKKLSDLRLSMYHAVAAVLADRFKNVVYRWIPRDDTGIADKLAKKGRDNKTLDENVLIFRPNPLALSRIVVNSMVFYGTTDAGMEVTRGQASSLIDASFLVSLPGYGIDSLRDDRFDPTLLTLCEGPGFACNVLGFVFIDRVEYSYIFPSDPFVSPFWIALFTRVWLGCVT